MIGQIKAWVRVIKRDVFALYFAARDTRTPKLAKFMAIVVVAYALSPIDLIPDFIPLLGLLDDVILLLLGIFLVVKLIPAGLLAEFRKRALDVGRLPASKTAAIFIIFIWMFLIAITILWVGRSATQAE